MLEYYTCNARAFLVQVSRNSVELLEQLHGDTQALYESYSSNSKVMLVTP